MLLLEAEWTTLILSSCQQQHSANSPLETQSPHPHSFLLAVSLVTAHSISEAVSEEGKCNQEKKVF